MMRQMRARSIARTAPGAAAMSAGGEGGIDRPDPRARLRRRVQGWLHRGHADPISRALGAGVGWVARRRARRPRPPAPTVPTIVVGGLSVGGAGRTPVVEWLARRLAADRRVVIVGHGYRAGVERPTIVDGPDAARFGDEAAALFAALGDVPRVRIVVGGGRGACHRAAASRADLIVVDDGFQDPDLPRTLDLVVVDATAGRRVMPAGPLREPLSALSRADAVWLSKIDEPGARPLPGPVDVTSRYVVRGVRLSDGRLVDAGWLAGRALRPLCAIGRPASFLHRLDACGVRILPGCVRADHHRFTTAELARLPDGPWVTTAKDRARLPPGFPAAVLEVEVEVVSGGSRLAALLSRGLR